MSKLLLIVTIFIAVVGSLWLARGGLSKGYTLYAKLPWGAGLKQGQPVWLVGVSVGYVDNVELEQNGDLAESVAPAGPNRKAAQISAGKTEYATGPWIENVRTPTPAWPTSTPRSPS